MKFKGISDLTQELNSLMSGIEHDKLTLDQLENANQLAREISERLIVLRHKAYEKYIRPETSFISDSEIAATIESASNEDTAEVTTPYFQMSLIDAIEEASANVEETPIVELHVGNEKSVDEELNMQAIDENTEAPEETTPILASTLSEENAKNAQEPIQIVNTPSPTISHPLSLADKHQFDKIDDLKRAITLNQRFQFSRELFKGNNQEYEVAIDRLNNSTREEALLMLRDLRAKFDWQEESAAALDFYGLIERRYSSL